MPFSHTLAGFTFTQANFEGTAYADEQSGFPKALEKIVEHVANAYRSPSSTQLTAGTGTQSLVIDSNRPFAIGQPVRIARVSDPAGVYMDGSVSAYDGNTGDMTVEAVSARGIGTVANDWMVSVGGVAQVGASASPVPVVEGGTGAADAAGARANLGLTNDAAGRANLGLGTISTVNSPVPVGNGGTGAADAATARVNLGLGNNATGRANLGLGSIATVASPVPLANGGTGATTAAGARTAIGLTNDAAGRATLGLGTISTVNSPLPLVNGGTAATSASAARTNLGLGTLATKSSPLAIADGGTGATTGASARDNLGLGNVAVDNVVPVARGGTGATTSTAARTNLGLGSLATLSSPLPVGNGGTGATSTSVARNNLGLGNMATVNSPVPLANGGTGATNAVQARANLGISTGPTIPKIAASSLVRTSDITVISAAAGAGSGWLNALHIRYGALQGTATLEITVDGTLHSFTFSASHAIQGPGDPSFASFFSGWIPFNIRFNTGLQVVAIKATTIVQSGRDYDVVISWSLD